jgi:hypothetical protein
MTDIILVKTIPASNLYSGSGSTTINLKSFGKIDVASKNEPLKIQIPKTKTSQNASPTDLPNNMVIDLKKITQTIRCSGWLDDDATETAWNKFWKLVAMQTRGGALYSLTIGAATPGKLIFPTANGSTVSTNPAWPTTTPQAFLTSISGSVESDDTGDISSSFSTKPARIKVDLDLYLGYER